MNALTARPSRTPPQYSGASINIRNVVTPFGHLEDPGRLTCPDTANIRIPVDVDAPMSWKACPDSLMIHGTLASVSTLLTIVGCMYKPLEAGKYGGFRRGIPRSPSRLSISAVSSPTM